jgi:hypothetical protein
MCDSSVHPSPFEIGASSWQHLENIPQSEQSKTYGVLLRKDIRSLASLLSSMCRENASNAGLKKMQS